MTKLEKTFLTDRQVKFLKELKKGITEEEIAEKYGLNKSTVEESISEAKDFIREAKRTVKFVEEEELEKIVRESEGEEENKLLEFVKKYRDKEWINYIRETRGEQAILKEAERLKNKYSNEWQKLVEKSSNSQ